MPKNNIPVIKPYNPLDKRNLAHSVADALLNSPVHPLPPPPFNGAGVYAIYYCGNFAPYKKLTSLNRNELRIPIYVGKAVPRGSRKGAFGMDVDHGTVLFNRLSEHFTSLSQAANLNVTDFSCRFLVVDDIWISPAESLLIELFKPLWNRCIEGFGNHDPGRGRYQQQISPWDHLHEGRVWAKNLQPLPVSQNDLIRKISQYLEATY